MQVNDAAGAGTARDTSRDEPLGVVCAEEVILWCCCQQTSGVARHARRISRSGAGDSQQHVLVALVRLARDINRTRGRAERDRTVQYC